MSGRICSPLPRKLLVALREGEEAAAQEALAQWLDGNFCPRGEAARFSGDQRSLFGEQDLEGDPAPAAFRPCPMRGVELVADLARVACEAGADPAAVGAVGAEAVRLLQERFPGGDVGEPLREAVRQWAALVRVGSSLSERIRRAVAHLHAHYTSPGLREKEVAQEAWLCLVRFRQEFRKETGKGYKEYLTNLRIEEAQRLLASTSLRLEEVALQVGYRSRDTFHRAFKRVVGVPPGRYRRQMEGKVGPS